MSFNVTMFRVMIASPSDVKDERECVDMVFSDWNRLNSQDKGCCFQSLMWEKDSLPSYSEEGPQAILNEQLCDKADIMVAILWSQFGTPTEKYGSGTEEEIQRFASTGKPLMLFLCTGGLPNDVDTKQLENVRKFVEHIKHKALYAEYKDLEDFKNKLKEKLTILSQQDNFQSLISCNTDAKSTVEERVPCLSVDFNGKNIIELSMPYGYSNSESAMSEFRKEAYEVLDDSFSPYDEIRCKVAEEIQEFKKNFPTKDSVEEYIKKWHLHNMLNSEQQLKINLHNSGTIKATGIFVDITIPDNVLVLEESDIDEYKDFSHQITPQEHYRFVKRQEEKAKSAKVMETNASGIATLVQAQVVSPIFSMPKIRIPKTFNQDHYSSVENNSITLHRFELPHHRQTSFGDLYILPVKQGEGKVIVNYHCDELAEDYSEEFCIIVK